jgi:ABC-type transporter Mla MlaB component
MRVEAGVAYLEGDLTLAQATRLLGECEAAHRAGARVYDLTGAGALDSSALSLLLSLRRLAGGQTVEFRHIPDGLQSLARLYGVAEQL